MLGLGTKDKLKHTFSAINIYGSMGPACTYVYSLANKNIRNKWLQNKLATQEEMTNALQI